MGKGRGEMGSGAEKKSRCVFPRGNLKFHWGAWTLKDAITLFSSEVAANLLHINVFNFHYSAVQMTGNLIKGPGGLTDS